MRQLIEQLPMQLRWAAAAEVTHVPAATEALVIGMGGSGIAGDIAKVALGGRVDVAKGYGLPSWAPDVKPLIVAVSHSGNTEETLSGVAAAVSAGLNPAVVTTGGRLADMAEQRNWPMIRIPEGPQPRAAIGYLAGAVARLLESAGLIDSPVKALGEAAEVTASLIGAGGSGSALGLADDLADGLVGKVAVVYGGDGVASVAANRWKTQINENGKAPAYWSAFPELDHNEIVGWEAYPEGANQHLGIVMLRDRSEHPRVERRIDLTRDLIASRVPIVGEVEAQGTSKLARLFSLVAIGDLVSVGIADKTGMDPMPVEIIERLKKELADE